MRTHRWTALALAGVISAVLVAPVRAQQVDVKPPAKIKRDKYVLLADEIAERPDLTNAYDAVRLLRPNFLKQTRPRGSMGASISNPYRPTTDMTCTAEDRSKCSSGSPASTGSGMGAGADQGGSSPYGGASGGNNMISAVYYLDEVKQEKVEDMRNVPVAQIVEIRFMGGTEASGRFGAGHEAGAILVKTNRMHQ